MGKERAAAVVTENNDRNPQKGQRSCLPELPPNVDEPPRDQSEKENYELKEAGEVVYDEAKKN
jgi:hypothetical protein